jgi:broad specificity phosphatase PhoE
VGEHVDVLLPSSQPQRAASAPAADREAALLRDLCGAKLILCSPLTRALQTCLIALGHACNLRSPGRHVHLAPNAREKRNHGAVDSIGCAIGEAEVRARLMQTTAELYEGDADAASRAVGGIELEDLEVRQRWWCTSPAESELEVHQRLAEFVRQIQYASEETIVLVGHSHWIRELLREYLHASVGRRDPEFAKRLASRKLSNCGVARLAFDFDESDETPITDVQLLCGTGLVK